MSNEYHLTFKQVIVRILSIIVGGIGTGVCICSLTIQVEQVGAVTASIMWFAGLAALVAALTGWAVSVDPGRGKSHVPAAAVGIIVVGIMSTIYLKLNVRWDFVVIMTGVVSAAIMGVVLVIYHFVLKAEDPDAL